MSFILSILYNRNSILVLAVVMGLLFGEFAQFLKPFTIPILAFVMAVSATGLTFKSLLPLRESGKIVGLSVLLNFVLFPLVLVPLAWIFIPDPMVFYGFVIIAASPVGAAVIPFTTILGGNIRYSVIGVLGIYIASIFLTPFIINTFTSGANIDPYHLLFMMLQVIVFPLALSQILILKPFKTYVEKYRGRFIDAGFALIIFTAVGLNQQIFANGYTILFTIAGILFTAIFVLGHFYKLLVDKLQVEATVATSQTLMLTIKSSAFTAATALSIFGEKAAVPSAVLSVMVLAYLIFLGLLFRFQQKPGL